MPLLKTAKIYFFLKKLRNNSNYEICFKKQLHKYKRKHVGENQ